VLHKLAAGSRKDVYGVIRMAESGSAEGIELEGRYGNEELAEMLAVMKKMLRVRDVVLRVNEEYIHSAGQQDEFRTEPAFRLQGSYRNMNRMAAKVEAVMNDRELETMIYSEYENEAQTLTTGAEANLLKFKEILGLLKEEEAERWAEIKKTYARHQMLRGAKDGDPASMAVAQLAGVGQGLTDIRDLIKEGVRAEKPATVQTELTEDTLSRIDKILADHKPPAPVGKQISETHLAEDTWTKLGSLLQQRSKNDHLDARYQSLKSVCRKWRQDFFIPLLKQCNNEPTEKAVTIQHLESLLSELEMLLGSEGEPE
jgi:hypothetical protein